MKGQAKGQHRIADERDFYAYPFKIYIQYVEDQGTSIPEAQDLWSQVWVECDRALDLTKKYSLNKADADYHIERARDIDTASDDTEERPVSVAASAEAGAAAEADAAGTAAAEAEGPTTPTGGLPGGWDSDMDGGGSVEAKRRKGAGKEDAEADKDNDEDEFWGDT